MNRSLGYACVWFFPWHALCCWALTNPNFAGTFWLACPQRIVIKVIVEVTETPAVLGCTTMTLAVDCHWAKSISCQTEGGGFIAWSLCFTGLKCPCMWVCRSTNLFHFGVCCVHVLSLLKMLHRYVCKEKTWEKMLQWKGAQSQEQTFSLCRDSALGFEAHELTWPSLLNLNQKERMNLNTRIQNPERVIF